MFFFDCLARNWETHLKTVMEQLKPLVTEKTEFPYQLKSFFFVSFERSHYPLFHSKYKSKIIITVFSSTGKQFILFLTANFLSKESDEQVFMNCLPLVKCWSKDFMEKIRPTDTEHYEIEQRDKPSKFAFMDFSTANFWSKDQKKTFFKKPHIVDWGVDGGKQVCSYLKTQVRNFLVVFRMYGLWRFWSRFEQNFFNGLVWHKWTALDCWVNGGNQIFSNFGLWVWISEWNSNNDFFEN